MSGPRAYYHINRAKMSFDGWPKISFHFFP